MQKIKSSYQEMLRLALDKEFKLKRLAIIDQKQLLRRAIDRFISDVELYMANHIPKNWRNGIAENAIEYRLAYILISRYYADPDAYQANFVGSIAADIYNEGAVYGDISNILSQITSKFAINAVVDLEQWISLGMASVIGLESNTNELNRSFNFNLWLTNSTERQTALKHLRAYQAVPPRSVDASGIQDIIGYIIRGKGTLISAANVPHAAALRSFIFNIIKRMRDHAFQDPTDVRDDFISDILSALTMFMIYINVTESDEVYDTAFPPLAVSGQNPIIYDKSLSTLRQLALLFTKSGVIHRAFTGKLSVLLIDELLKLLPDGFDNLNSTSVRMDTAGNQDEPTPTGLGAVSIDLAKSAHANIFLAKHAEAKRIIDSVLPIVIKDYMPGVIQSMKDYAGVDLILPSICLDIETVPGENETTANPLVTNLLAQVVNLPDVTTDPDEPIDKDLRIMSFVMKQNLIDFIVFNIYPAIEAIFIGTNDLQTTYDEIMRNIGGSFGSMIPGLNLELSLDKSTTSLAEFKPLSDDIMNVQYSRIDKRYEWPWHIQPLKVLNDADFTQRWIFSDIIYRIFKPKTTLLNHLRNLRNGTIPQDAVNHTNILKNMHPDFLTYDTWSWSDSDVPVPSYMNEALFSYGYLPFIYTGTRVYDKFNKSATKYDEKMTLQAGYPNADRMRWSEYLYKYLETGTINPINVAMALANVGMLYSYDDKAKSWVVVNPHLPTIYGMPTIFMHDENDINLDANVAPSKTTPNRFVRSEKAKDEVINRIMFDQSTAEPSLRKFALVLYDKVPRMQRVVKSLTWLRHGFIVDMPYISSIYTALEHKIRTSAADADKTPRIKNFLDQVAKDMKDKNVKPSPIQIATTFSFLHVVMFSEPAGLVSTTAEAYYANTFQDILKKDYKAFKKEMFAPIYKWSNVITPYGHIAFNNTLIPSTDLESISISEPYATSIFVSDFTFRSEGYMKWLTLYDPDMYMLDSADRIAIEKSDLFSAVKLGKVVNYDLSTGAGNQAVKDAEKLHTITQANKGSGEAIEIGVQRLPNGDDVTVIDRPINPMTKPDLDDTGKKISEHAVDALNPNENKKTLDVDEIKDEEGNLKKDFGKGDATVEDPDKSKETDEDKDNLVGRNKQNQGGKVDDKKKKKKGDKKDGDDEDDDPGTGDDL